MDVDEYRRTALESWQSMAGGWERRREDIERVRRALDVMLSR